MGNDKKIESKRTNKETTKKPSVENEFSALKQQLPGMNGVT